MNFDVDVLVLGSGPAGVSAAFPLVEAGFRVIMLDAGDGVQHSVPEDTFYNLRTTNSAQWKTYVGDDFYALRPQRTASPKLRAPTNVHVFAGYEQAYRLTTDEFVAVGSLATGGLSNAWGAGVSCLNDSELAQLPVNSSDIKRSYKKVAARIGISGSNEDDLAEFHGTEVPMQPPMQLGVNAARLFERYSRKPEAANRRGLRLGHGRNAVLTTKLDQRYECGLCAMCLWGCNRRSIYSSSFDLEALQAKPNFQYRGSAWVDSLEPTSDGYTVRYQNRTDKTYSSITAMKVIVACGTIGSARLVLQTLGLYKHDIPLLANPTMGFALSLPARLGATVQESTFGLSQLSFMLDEPGHHNEYAFGNLFASDGLLTSEFVDYIPMSRPSALRFMRLLAPALLLGNCFLPGSYSDHSLRLQPDGSLKISGRYSESITSRVKDIRQRLASALRRYGAWLLPGSVKLTAPGEDIHYAGTLPMKNEPLPHQTQADGQVAGLPGVYIADAAALPKLYAKPHTFTVMANADRIARGIVRLQEASI